MTFIIIAVTDVNVIFVVIKFQQEEFTNFMR